MTPPRAHSTCARLVTFADAVAHAGNWAAQRPESLCAYAAIESSAPSIHGRTPLCGATVPDVDSHTLYRTYAPCVIGLATASDGVESMGTAFHIGDGFFLTARHVVEGRAVVDVVVNEGTLSTIHSIHYPSDPAVDLAILSTDFDLSHYMERVKIVGADWEKVDAIGIGTHLDDWVEDGMVLMPVVMMGFPPVPTSRGPLMLAVSGEVNAVLDRYTTPHVHFIVSSPARGGFSGGPVLYAGDGLLGVVTESLQREPERGEPGFAVALSVEPVYVLLAELGIAPRANRLSCYLLSSIYDTDGPEPSDTVFDRLLTPEERAAFDRWTGSLQDSDMPPSLGTPSPPLIDGPSAWRAQSDDRPPTMPTTISAHIEASSPVD